MPYSHTWLCAHFVFSTKDRVESLRSDMPARLFQHMGGIVRADRSQLVAANAMEDHVHLLARVHPSVAVADLLREVKARSSSFIREPLADVSWDGRQDGYAALGVSRSGPIRWRRTSRGRRSTIGG